MSIIFLTYRAWGWSLIIMALVFFAFGFSGPYLPGLLEHFGVNIRDFMQIVWYSFDGVFLPNNRIGGRQRPDFPDFRCRS
jgi:TRAP-type uncharacterized transport system fused permease subunit